MAFSGVKSDGGNPSFGSNNVVIFKSIFIGDPGTKDGNWKGKFKLFFVVRYGQENA